MGLIRQQRLLRLCEGTLFHKISSRRRQGHCVGGGGVGGRLGGAGEALSLLPATLSTHRQAVVLLPVSQPQSAAVRGRGGGSRPTDP